MIVTVTNSTAHPSAAAVSSGNVPDDSSNSASLVAMAALTATFVVLVISLLGYRRFRRTSGAVWISKVLYDGMPSRTLYIYIYLIFYLCCRTLGLAICNPIQVLFYPVR